MFLQHCTETVRNTNAAVCQAAEYWPRNPFVTESPSIGGAGFDVAWNDGFRESVRAAIASASGGENAFVDLDWVAREIVNPGFRDGWRAVNCLESHDEIYRDREPRVARLADSSNSRSWYARSRSRVGAALVLTSPGMPMLFMGQEILEDKNWSDDPAHHPNTLIWWDGSSRGEQTMIDMHRCVRDLVGLRRSSEALRYGKTRVFHVDLPGRVIAFHRWVEGIGADVVVVASLRDRTHYDYRIGLPRAGAWRELFNTDVYDHWVNPRVAGNGGLIVTTCRSGQGFAQSAALVVPANAVLVLMRA